MRETMSGLVIRSVATGDAGLVARLHTKSMQASYAGILPDEYLQDGIEAERSAYWARAFDDGNYAAIFVAEVGGAPAGFVAVTLHSEPGYDATIEHLHVLPDMKGRGLGRRLIARMASHLAGEGHANVCLRVFEDNAAAIGFYEKLGGVTDSYGVDRMAGSNAPDRRMGWHDLPALERACQAGAPA